MQTCKPNVWTKNCINSSSKIMRFLSADVCQTVRYWNNSSLITLPNVARPVPSWMFEVVTTCFTRNINRSITGHFRIPNTCVHGINHQQVRQQTLRRLQFKLAPVVAFLSSAAWLFSRENKQQFRTLCTEIYRCSKPFHIIKNMQ
jgi:hypothetical protein